MRANNELVAQSISKLENAVTTIRNLLIQNKFNDILVPKLEGLLSEFASNTRYVERGARMACEQFTNNFVDVINDIRDLQDGTSKNAERLVRYLNVVTFKDIADVKNSLRQIDTQIFIPNAQTWTTSMVTRSSTLISRGVYNKAIVPIRAACDAVLERNLNSSGRFLDYILSDFTSAISRLLIDDQYRDLKNMCENLLLDMRRSVINEKLAQKILDYTDKLIIA